MKTLLIFLFVFLVVLPRFTYVELNEQNKTIRVSVEGEVEQKGVVSLARFATINDLLQQVQVSEEADLSAMSRFTVLKEGDTVVIPQKSNLQKVSINYATVEELCTLKGIGVNLANRIISYRVEHGLFQQLEDLMDVNGIGEAKFQRIVDSLCL